MKPFIGSYTALNTFKNVCEHQFYRRYIKKDQPYVETEAMRWGNEVHKAFEDRVGRGIVLPDTMRQWEKHAEAFDAYKVHTELQLGINRQGAAVGYWDGSVWFRGKVDVAVIVNDKALLTDWKTGSSKYEDPFELEIGALLLKAKFPSIMTVVGRYVYLKEDRAGQMHELSNFAQTWEKINMLMALIEFKRQKEPDISFEKRKSGLCGYCSVEDCEHHFVARP